MISIYRPPSQNSEYFLNVLTNIIDYISSVDDNHLLIGDFKPEPNDPCMKSFLNSNVLPLDQN